MRSLPSPLRSGIAGARRLLSSPTVRVWGLTAALFGAGALLWLDLREVPPPAGPLRLPWWALAVAFAATEVCVVHIHFRRGAHTLTLSDIPLVLGLLFSAPADVVVAWVIGSAVVLAAQRGRPVRLVFNLAQYAVTAAVAAETFTLLAGESAASGPATWLVAAVAAVVGALVTSTLVLAAMALSGERVRGRRLVATVLTTVLMTPTNASLALAAGAVLHADARAAILLVAPVVVLFVAYRAYTAERAKHRNLEFLYDATRALTRGGGADTGLAGMLAIAVESFRVEVAELCVFPSPERPGGARMVLAGDGRVALEPRLDPALAGALSAFVDEHPAGRVVDVEKLAGAVAGHLRSHGMTHALIGALPGEQRLVGVLTIANRAVGGFDRDDLRLFNLLAHHTGASLEQDRLGRKVAELRELQRDLEHRAFHDPLTGLANRLLFMDRVGHALSRRSGNAAVFYIDLDEFKAINDTLGHEAGDMLLQETARRLRDALRDSDTPARLGGDEFAVLLTDIEEQHSRIVAERVLRKLRDPFRLAGRDVPVYASLGVALAPSGTMDADELVRNADVAMYVSKHGGKRGYTVFGHDTETHAQASAPVAP